MLLNSILWSRSYTEHCDLQNVWKCSTAKMPPLNKFYCIYSFLFFCLFLLLLLSLLQCSVIGWIHVSSHFNAVRIRIVIGWCSNPTPPPPTTHLPKPWRRWVGKQMCASGGAALLKRRRRRHSGPPQVTEHQNGDSGASGCFSLPLIYFHSQRGECRDAVEG